MLLLLLLLLGLDYWLHLQGWRLVAPAHVTPRLVLLVAPWTEHVAEARRARVLLLVLRREGQRVAPAGVAP